jgi:hypothetical protein
VAHRLPYFVPPLPAAQAPRLEENPYESVPVLGPLHRYSNQNRNGKDRSRSGSVKSGSDKYKYLSSQQQYGGDYYGLQGQSDVTAPLYTQVGGEYSDTYSQPSDRLFGDDKYSQPVYYTNSTTRDSACDQVATTGRLYQGQPDSSFGSDSGYSHHTTGTNGTRGSNSRTNHRRDKHRNSHHSHHSADYIVS